MYQGAPARGTARSRAGFFVTTALPSAISAKLPAQHRMYQQPVSTRVAQCRGFRLAQCRGFCPHEHCIILQLSSLIAADHQYR